MPVTFPNGNWRSFTVIHSTTSEATLYTVPGGVVAAYFAYINVSDDAADSTTYTLKFTDSSGSTTATLLSAKALAANTPLSQDYFIAMEPGDTLKGTPSQTGMHAVVTIHEVAGRRG